MAGYDIAWQVEIDTYCQKLLELRFPESKKYHDIKKVKGSKLEPVDVVAGGFPCQPFSVAGKQRGCNDNRDLWPQMRRIVSEVRPPWVVCENVPGLINIPVERVRSEVDVKYIIREEAHDLYEAFHLREDIMYLNRICEELEEDGYQVVPLVFSAHSVGAWHKRDRLWIVGFTERGRQRGKPRRRAGEKSADGHSQLEEGAVFDASEQGLPFGRGSSLGNAREEKPKFERSSGLHGRSSIAPNPDQLNDDGSRHGTGKVCGEQRKEADISAVQGGSSSDPCSSRPQRTKQRGTHQEGQRSQRPITEPSEVFRDYWSTEPAVGRVVTRASNRVDRLKALGNGQVPACTYIIGRYILEVESLMKGKNA